jgi:hypothetical protein
LLSWALSASAQAVIVSSNSDAVFGPPIIRFCQATEVQAAPTGSLCQLSSIVEGASPLEAARSAATSPWIAVGGLSADAPLSAAEAHRVVPIPDLPPPMTIGFVNNGRQFDGTWQQNFSGTLLLQVAEVRESPNVLSRTVYYYYLPDLQAQSGDLLRFAPALGTGNQIAWVGLYTLTPIPEPSTWALMALGVATLALRRKSARAA